MADNRRTNAGTTPATRRQEAPGPAFLFTPEIEREIAKLDGVISARVLASGSTIDEIHVLSNSGRPAKKVVRDIESLLIVHFGIRIDHRKIGVAHLAQVAARVESARPQILSVVEKENQGELSVCIELGQDGRIYRGEATIRPGETELHVSSRALLAAVEKLLNLTHVIMLRDVSLVNLAGQQIIVVLLNWLMDEEVSALVGATVAQGNLLESAARATFDALNRKLVRAGGANRARALAKAE